MEIKKCPFCGSECTFEKYGSHDLDNIISGLQFTIDMFLRDPLTGEMLSKPRNSLDEITITSCLQAIEVLKKIK